MEVVDIIETRRIEVELALNEFGKCRNGLIGPMAVPAKVSFNLSFHSTLRTGGLQSST
jgi:hypothetical protein